MKKKRRKIPPENKELAQRMEALIERVGLTHQQIIAASGNKLTTGYVTDIISGSTGNPGIEKVVLLARGMGLPLAVLLHELGYDVGIDLEREPAQFVVVSPSREARKRLANETERYTAIPVLEESVAAGAPRSVYAEHETRNYALIYSDWVKEPNRYVCVEITGDSMEPILPSGSVVCIDTKEADAEHLVGHSQKRIVAVRHEGGVTVKWLEGIDPESGLLLRPENPEYRCFCIRPEEDENPVIGVVAWSWSKWEG